MEVNGIKLTQDEEQLFKHILDVGMSLIEQEGENYAEKAELLLDRLGIFKSSIEEELAGEYSRFHRIVGSAFIKGRISHEKYIEITTHGALIIDQLYCIKTGSDRFDKLEREIKSSLG